jgi:hypothetical protein
MSCACLGPQNGEPLCPCRMRAARAHFGTHEVWQMPRKVEPIKIPISLLMELAEHLQWRDEGVYGKGLDCKQMKRAEAVIRRFVRELGN